VNATAANLLVVYFLVFCRVGTAFMFMPALGGPRYPALVRVLLSLAVSLALTPMIQHKMSFSNAGNSGALIVNYVLVEISFGLIIGFWGLCFIYGARFAGTFIVNMIGLAGIPGQPVDEQEPSSHLVTLLSLGTTALIFASDGHLMSIKALIASYDQLPFGRIHSPATALSQTLVVLRNTFIVALQVSSPFLLLTVVVNFALGLANRMTPQLSVYFAFTGVLTIVSLVGLAALSPNILMWSVVAYENFLVENFN
jgi:flagellar biosynthesis protein FliR